MTRKETMDKDAIAQDDHAFMKATEAKLPPDLYKGRHSRAAGIRSASTSWLS
jgi:hypothetical protein